MSNQRVVPLTKSGPLWSQREYVACREQGIGFAAHRHRQVYEAFHYGFPGDVGCTTVIVSTAGPEKFIDHEFTRDIDWIERCAAATERAT